MQQAAHQQQRQQQAKEDADRTNRFLSPHGNDLGSSHLRERAASQPPRVSAPGLHSPLASNGVSFPRANLAADDQRGSSPWMPRTSSGLNPNAAPMIGMPQSVPTRSSSFSAGPVPLGRSSSGFGSTLEEDAGSEALSESFDERYEPPPGSAQARGRTFAMDITRSRSQSLATPGRQLPIGSPFAHPGTGWGGDSASALPIPATRYGDLRPPGPSRYGSLGANVARSPPGTGLGGGVRHDDISNISPFVRDVSQILLDDSSAFRELWQGMHVPRDEHVPGGSGTTSRRHSVSIVQPRREIIGFNVDGHDFSDEPVQQHSFGRGAFGRGARISDDDLAADLGMMSLGQGGVDTAQSYSHHRQSSGDPGSLPMHARTPSGQSAFQQPLNLQIPSGSFGTRGIGSPHESASSPRTGAYLDHHGDAPYLGGGAGRAAAQVLGARYVPGQGIQYPNGAGMEGLMASPPSAGFRGTGNGFGVQQSILRTPLSAHSAHAPQVARRASDATNPGFDNLGRGVPLSAVPSSWPLYIVEFKAGRTDLFYSTDLALDIRAGDLVIVEADRGKDLGKVVNDTITLAEVDAFQKQQQASTIGFSGDGTPGAPPQTKEINPKMIYGKASAHDAQVYLTKSQDEEKALQLCQQKVRQKKLPMEVIDAEYQWDRRKLTFYFIADKRIDFRELVRELFRLYKTRIWMASLQGPSPGGFEQ